MDYIFSDKQYSEILKKAKAAGIKDIFVMTPSLFHVHQFRNFIICSHDWFMLFQYLFHQMKHQMKLLLFPIAGEKGEEYWSYKRTYLHFVRLFTKVGFHVKRKKVFLNPNGSYHLFRFRIKN